MGKKDKERRVYPKEFKAEAVGLAEKREKPVDQIAEDLGINRSLLWKWMQQARESAGTGLQGNRVATFPGHGRPKDESDFSPRLPACGKKTKRCGRRRTKVR
jgi:transposase-like protein